MGDDEALGGDQACWAADVEADGHDGRSVVEPDVDASVGSGGVVWHLPPDGDLNANLVRLGPGERIGEHPNDEVDVLIVVRDGRGEIVIDDVRHPLSDTSVALVRRGARRMITAGTTGLSYLTVHRRRDRLAVGSRRT